MGLLTWSKIAGMDGFEARSGDLVVGVVLRRSVDGQIAYDATFAVKMKWIHKTHGDVASFASGKRAIERAWKRWLGRAGLAPADSAGKALDALRADVEARRGETLPLAVKGWGEEKGGLAELNHLLALIDRHKARLDG